MPGLNQLKQFSEDVRKLGDEEKIRAQRGEKTAPLPLPEGISEADDSDDFIIGLPDPNRDAASQGEADIPEGDINLADLGIDSLLDPQVSADDADLADFLNDDLGASSEAGEPAESADDLLASLDAPADETPLEDLDLDDLLKPSEDSGVASIASEADTTELPPLPDDDTGMAEPLSAADEPAASAPDDLDLASLDMDSLLGDFSGESPASDAPAADASAGGDSGLSLDGLDSLGDISDLGNLDFPEQSASDASLSSGGADNGGAESPIPDLADLDNFGSADGAASSDAASSAAPDLADFGNMGDFGLPSDLGAGEISLANDDSSIPTADFSAEPLDSSADSEPVSGDFGSDLDALGDLGGMDSLDSAAPGAGGLGDIGSFDIDSLVSDSDGSADSPEIPDASAEVPDGAFDVPSDGTEELSLDSFDMSGMDGVDFGSPKPASGDEFPATDDTLGGDDDFLLDDSFEIPGYTGADTDSAGKKKAGLDTVDFSQGKEGAPRNALTDEEYAQFKKNLSNYPLNLRIAVEDFISNDEFTDDAVFEIIEKVLKKTPARQLATQLEKILDISINIPRDFERRSFAEYEAYKQSFQYQLKNRLIPAAIVGVILAFVCMGLFKAGVHFVYKPVMANIHYKQGYTLLEANEFPQSEQEFQEAVSYRPVKKWFFKYANGYREKRQYERAAQMYNRTLAYFNHDKQAGIEYAEMELYDRANYERAEEIVRREVLDYHINDADGILLLGDVFLEWVEIAPEKYELAKQQYLDLLQRYGSNNVYLSRMLRYNIRTDKLREVLTYKNMFYVSKQDKQNLKNLSAADWTELSGYLLEKLYGKLSKNDEYLRSSIEDVLAMLNLAIRGDPSNPVARYNLARYFIQNGNTEQAKVELERSLDLFDSMSVRTKKNIYREINATRVLGELYAGNREYLRAQTVYTRGINLFNEEQQNSGLEGTEDAGRLFADMGDLDYFVSGDLDDALFNYEESIKNKNDTPSINFRVGAIYYGRKDYDSALASFIKVAEKEPRNPNILLSLGNVLSLRGDNFAAESYYSDLLHVLDGTRDASKFLMPQEVADDYETVDLYLKANNNLGVTLYRLAHQTGNSNMNAESIVRLSDSMRAWDALTRNPETMIRMEGSNLAAQNSKYITHPYPDFEPAIYTDIPRVLAGEKGLE